MADFFLAALERFRENVRFADVLDIGVIAVLLYLAQGWFRQRASRSVAIAILLLVLLYMVAHVLDMYLTILLFQAGFVAALLAMIVIFQEDLRRAFERMASWSIFGGQTELPGQSSTVDVLVESMVTLAQQRIGTLIVIQGREPLQRHLRGGTDVHGHISLPLLYSIFHPETPGHDGAVLIAGDLIEKISVHLPLSKNMGEIGTTGTRHAAALGLAERSDALVIVVSEERGTISIAQGARLEVLSTAAELKRRLEQFYDRLQDVPILAGNWYHWLINDLAMKASSLLLALLLWLLLASQFENVQRVMVASVQYRNLPRSWTLGDTMPTTAQVTLSGSERLFDLLDSDSLIISVDLAQARQGGQNILLTEDNVERPAGLMVEKIEPQVIRLDAYPTTLAVVPIRAEFSGDLPPDKEVEEVTVRPDKVTVIMRSTLRNEIRSVPTEPIDLSRVEESFTRQVELALPQDVKLAEGAPANVRVNVRLRSKQPEDTRQQHVPLHPGRRAYLVQAGSSEPRRTE